MDLGTLQRIESLFCESGAVKTRRYNLTFYPNTWTGRSLVDWLVSPQVILGRILQRRLPSLPRAASGCRELRHAHARNRRNGRRSHV
jgi:hypothetical protein